MSFIILLLGWSGDRFTQSRRRLEIDAAARRIESDHEASKNFHSDDGRRTTRTPNVVEDIRADFHRRENAQVRFEVLAQPTAQRAGAQLSGLLDDLVIDR